MKNNLLLTPIQSDIAETLRPLRFPNEFMQFVLWSATPKQLKVPKNQKDFAVSIGVNQDTLTDWKHRPDFWPLVLQALSDWVKDRAPDVVGSLYQNALAKGKAGDVKAFLQLAGLSQTKPPR